MEKTEEPPLTIHDLRPHLGRLNWQLRRINKGIVVTIDENERIVSVSIADSQGWIITCDQCKQEYESTQKIPTCPRCGCAEMGDPD